MPNRCALCKKQISNPAERIIYDGHPFDRSICADIFKKLRFIYGSSIVDIIES